MDATPEILATAFKDKSLENILESVEAASLTRKTLCHPKAVDSRVLAQVLGFKFVYYQVIQKNLTYRLV